MATGVAIFLLINSVFAAFDPNELLCLVNVERAAAGVPLLGYSARLSAAAQAHSNDMASADTMSHTGTDGSTPGDRVSRYGFQWTEVGENIAYGYDSLGHVMEAWMNSNGHRANILGQQFQMFGAGVAQGSDGLLYWTQDFGTDGYAVRNIPQCTPHGQLIQGFTTNLTLTPTTPSSSSSSSGSSDVTQPGPTGQFPGPLAPTSIPLPPPKPVLTNPTPPILPVPSPIPDSSPVDLSSVSPPQPLPTPPSFNTIGAGMFSLPVL